jgi:hypothetical protein
MLFILSYCIGQVYIVGKKGDGLLFLEERAQRLILDRKSEKVACPLFLSPFFQTIDRLETVTKLLRI